MVPPAWVDLSWELVQDVKEISVSIILYRVGKGQHILQFAKL
jgi:hypothetical protein